MNIPTPNRGQIFAEISLERLAQDTKHGIQDLPIRPDDPEVQERIRNMAEGFKKLCDRATETGNVTFYEVLLEEVMEAFAADTEAEQRQELVQVAAVAVKAIETIDRRNKR